tara:strand:+ start:744 stop:2207 length:1464 start_codon:yes stop_codon:yes gene_type:complete
MFIIKQFINGIYLTFLYFKYFFYFNLFILTFITNILYYYFFLKTNKKFVDLLYYSVNKNGCIIIKLIQWLHTNIDILDINNKYYIIELFDNFYENCNIHSLNYTKKMFKKEFNKNFDEIFDLDKNYKIRSASIAQIYKAKLKNNEIVEYNSDIVIKVVHPEIKFQLFFPVLFIKFYLFCIEKIYFLKKYDTIFNIDSFLKNLILQLDMINEYENIKYFYNRYKNNSVIIIPQPISASKNFLLMEYIEGETLENLNASDLIKQEAMTLICLFLKDNYFFADKFHCDLHDSNWKIKMINHEPKLIIYDFGYILNNSEQFRSYASEVIYCLDTNNSEKLSEILYDYIINQDCNFDEFKVNFNKYYSISYPYTDKNIINVYKFCYENNYKLRPCMLEFFISLLLLKKHFKKYLFITDCKIYNKSVYINYLIKINQKYIYLCDKYKIFDNIKKFVQKKYIESSYIKKFYYYQDDNLNNIETYTQSNIQTFDI